MPSAAPRRHDLDALRVFACYLLFVFHVGMVFNPAPFFHVRNADSSMAFLVICGFIGLWHMPVLFLLAGWSAATSLRSRGVGAFLRERWRKLAIPLAAACVLLVPVIKYLELRSGQDLNHRGLFVSEAVGQSIRSVIPVDLPRAEPFDERFLDFLPTFFTNLDRFTWSHLWFVAYLLAFTLVLLPLLAAVVRLRPQERRPARAWVYLPILPLAVIQLALRERFPGPYNLYNDWANVSYFLIFLLAGAGLAVVPALEERLREERVRLLALGTVATGLLLAAVLGAITAKEVVLVASAVAGYCFVAALVAFSREAVTSEGPRLSYLAESAFPIYVLHQPVIVVLAALVVTLPLGIAAKFALLLAGSLAATLAIYHFGVRPHALPRFLLGMKPVPQPRDLASGSAAHPPDAPRRLPAGAGTTLLLAVALLLSSASARAAEPTGLWWAEGGAAQVEILPCEDALCGRVVWLRHPFAEDGCTLRDAENPDPALRGRAVLGLTLLRGLRPAPGAEKEWNDGEIYDPSSGRTYRAFVELDGPDRLRVRGFFGLRMLGRTTTWSRVGSESRCTDPA